MKGYDVQMSITINLVSEKHGELEQFLSNYFEKDMSVDSDTLEWTYTFRKPLDSVSMINAIIDNSDIYSFTPWISMDKDLFIKIEENNHNDLVKYIFDRFRC